MRKKKEQIKSRDVFKNEIFEGDYITFNTKGNRIPHIAKVVSFTRTGTPRVKFRASDTKPTVLTKCMALVHSVAGTSTTRWVSFKLSFIKIYPTNVYIKQYDEQ
jgi:hypothetical protein